MGMLRLLIVPNHFIKSLRLLTRLITRAIAWRVRILKLLSCNSLSLLSTTVLRSEITAFNSVITQVSSWLLYTSRSFSSVRMQFSTEWCCMITPSIRAKLPKSPQSISRKEPTRYYKPITSSKASKSPMFRLLSYFAFGRCACHTTAPVAMTIWPCRCNSKATSITRSHLSGFCFCGRRNHILKEQPER